jgi:pimeloyl-ACP methyl ester carboxylesterase
MACLAVGLVGGEVWVGADRSCETNGTCFAPRIVRYNSSGGYTGQFFDESVLPVDNSSGTARIRAIKADGAGRVWVGFSAGGVRVFTLATQQWEAIAEPIIPSGAAINFNAISVGQDGKVYIGSTAGLIIYDGSGVLDDPASHALLTTINGLPSNSVNQIAFDGGGAIWLATTAGVAVIRPSVSLEFINQRNFQLPVPLASSAPNAHTAFKVCADGSQSSLFKFVCPDCDLGNVRFRLWNTLGSNDPALYGKFPSVNYTLSGDTLSAFYIHPSYLELSGQTHRTDSILVVDTVQQVNLFSNALEVYRAPMVLTHGLGADLTTFAPTITALVAHNVYPSYGNGQSGSPLLHNLDYSATNKARFAVNRDKVPNAIDALFAQCTANHYSAGKVIAAGHSMGGILSRLYLQSSWQGYHYRGDIAKLITMNTPHYGSQTANYLLSLPTTNTLSLFAGILNPGIATNNENYGAYRDLRVNSRATVEKLGITQAQQSALNALVPTVALATDQTGDYSSSGSIALRGLLAFALAGGEENIFNGDTHDLIVAMTSQRCDLTNPPATVMGQIHAQATWNTQVIDQLEDAVGADPASTYFAHAGIPPHALVYTNELASDSVVHNNEHPVPLQNRSAQESVSIEVPAPGAIYAPESYVEVELSFSGGITSLSLFALGSGLEPILVDTNAVSLVLLHVPADALGRVNLYVMASDGNDWVADDSTHFFVSPSSLPDSISASPSTSEIALGFEATINVVGYFNGSGTAVVLNGDPGLEFIMDPSALLALGNGQYKAIGVGSTSIEVSYLGLTDQVVVTVVDDPTQLQALFDYDTDVICEDQSITFTDLSQGLVTDLEWTFEGGTPSTSTDPTVEVVYETPGEYAVTLSATFVNGENTTILDSLIFVTGAPDTLVISTGSTLEAADGDYTYQWYDCATSSDIEGATEPHFTPEANGSYAVRLTNGACTLSSGCHLVLSEGIPETVFGNGLELHPNPNDGSFVLMLDKPAQSAHVEILDVMGRIVMRTGQLESQRVAIHFDGAPGVYTIRAFVDGTERTGRMVKW